MNDNDGGDLDRTVTSLGSEPPAGVSPGDEAATAVFSNLFCPVCGGRFPGGLSVCTEDGVGLVPVGIGDDLSGTVLNNKYVLVQLIGRGGFGNVYRATHKLARTEIAIKVIKDDLRDNEKAVRQFLKETRALMSIQSMHVVTVHDVDRDADGRIFIVMELLRGRDLEDCVRQDHAATGRMPWPDVARIVLQVCDALECAHEKGIVHRDLKPGNVMMVSGRGGVPLAKVVDFGIASLAQSENMDLTTMDAVPRVIGTPSFMSPEQAKGQAVDQRADLYSLGAMIYRLVCGCKPFDAKTDQGMLIAHVIEKPRPIRERCPELDVPVAFDALVMQLMAKTPEERPASAVEVAHRIRDILPASESSRRSGHGGGGWKVAVAAAVVLLLAAGAAAFWLFVREPVTVAVVSDVISSDAQVVAQVEPVVPAPAVETPAPVAVPVSGVQSAAGAAQIQAPAKPSGEPVRMASPAGAGSVSPAEPVAAPVVPAAQTSAPVSATQGPRAALPAVPVPSATSTASGGNIVAPAISGGAASAASGGAASGPMKAAIPAARPGQQAIQPAVRGDSAARPSARPEVAAPAAGEQEVRKVSEPPKPTEPPKPSIESEAITADDMDDLDSMGGSGSKKKKKSRDDGAKKDSRASRNADDEFDDLDNF